MKLGLVKLQLLPFILMREIKKLKDWNFELWNQLKIKDENIALFSRKPVDWTCRTCGTDILQISPAAMNKKINPCLCEKCIDSYSYGEKFIYAFLLFNKIDFEYHKKFKWSERKEYDFYLKKEKTIIEVHGIQHYKYAFSFKGFRNRSLEEEQENDKLKYNMAKQHGLNYIIIDARYSEFYFLRKNVLNSNLLNLVDINNVDWEKISKFCLRPFYEDLINLWNSGMYDLKELSEKTNICKNACANILKRYNNLLSIKYEDIHYPHKTRKKVEVFLNNKLVKEYDSILDLCEKSLNDFNVKFDFRNVSAVCRGKERTHKGYFFRFSGSTCTEKNKKTEIAVIQYSMNNIYINEFKSIKEAARVTNTNVSGIRQCCVGKYKSSNNYIWKYKNKNQITKKVIITDKIKRAHEAKMKKVFRYNVFGEYIDSYNSVNEASEKTGISVNCIAQCCRGLIKFSNNFIFKYEETLYQIKDYKNNFKIVYKLNLNGEVINRYITIAEAERENGFKHGYIYHRIHKYDGIIGDYIWKIDNINIAA